MKILLDENLPHRLRPLIVGHNVFTVAYMNWAGIENGELLSLAAANGFEAIITKDNGMPYDRIWECCLARCWCLRQKQIRWKIFRHSFPRSCRRCQTLSREP